MSGKHYLNIKVKTILFNYMARRRGPLDSRFRGNDVLFTILPIALLVFAVFAAYGNVYGNEFLLDDEFLILKNEYLRFWGALPKLLTSCSTAGFGGQDSFYRPLQGLLYFVVFQFAGLSLFWFHFLNVALHAVNACLVYLLGRRLGFDQVAVFCAALLWAAHPVHTESVTYISATADPLYALFCLAGVCALLPDFAPRRMVWGCAFFALALLSKETAIAFPLLAMICLFLVSDKRFNYRTYIKTWPLWAVAALYMAVRIYLLQMSDVAFYKEVNILTASPYVRFSTFLATLPAYFKILLWPADLHMLRDFPVFTSIWMKPVVPGLIIFLAALAIMGTAVSARGKKSLALSWGIGWFFAAHLLHSGVLMPVNALLNEHWMYLPTVGLTLGTAQTLAMIKQREIQISLGVAAVALAIVLGILSFQQNKLWRDPAAFYENILRYGDKSMSLHNNLGMAYAERGEPLKAIEHYRAAIELSDTFAQPHHNIARTLLDMPDGRKHIPEAIAELEKAIAINPRFYQSYELLAEIYEQTGEKGKAYMYRAKANAILNSR